MQATVVDYCLQRLAIDFRTSKKLHCPLHHSPTSTCLLAWKQGNFIICMPYVHKSSCHSMKINNTGRVQKHLICLLEYVLLYFNKFNIWFLPPALVSLNRIISVLSPNSRKSSGFSAEKILDGQAICYLFVISCFHYYSTWHLFTLDTCIHFSCILSALYTPVKFIDKKCMA